MSTDIVLTGYAVGSTSAVPYGRSYLLMMIGRSQVAEVEVEEDAVPSDADEEGSTPVSPVSSEPAVEEEEVMNAEQKLLKAALGGDDEEDAGEVDLEDYYALLGLTEKKFSASQRDIKKAYHKMMVKHHPDKNTDTTSTSETDPLFLAIKKAFDTLSNDDKRRGYDSKYDFDDAIPTGNETFDDTQAFLDLYGPIMTSNGRFSVVKPVPQIGGVDASHEDLIAFYNFWKSFGTWREFNSFDEHNPDDADSRDEKRWMQQKNEQIRRKHKKKELKRLRMLADRAYAADPRVELMQTTRRNSRIAAEAEKEAAAKASMEAMRASVEEGRKRRLVQEQEEKATRASAKKEKQKASKAKSRARKKIATACVTGRVRLGDLERAGNSPPAAATIPVFEDYDVMWLCDRIEVEQMRALTAGFKAVEEETEDDAIVRGLGAVGILLLEVQTAEKAIADAKAKEALRLAAERDAAEAARKEALNVPWKKRELFVLAKAVKKIPGGARHRWEQIAGLVNALGLPHQRTEKECIKQAQLSKNGESQQNFGAGDAFNSFKAGQAQKRAKQAMFNGSNAESKVASPATKSAGGSSPGPGKRKGGRGGRGRGRGRGRGGGRGGGGAGGGADSAEPWSHDQQLAIEAGIAKFPYTVPQRWKHIAAMVEGRKPKEVRERAEEMCFGNIPRATPEDTKLDEGEAPATADLGAGTTPNADVTPAAEGGADEWTTQQQRALEDALVTFPASMPAKERWKSIGNAVEGRKAKECLAHFKAIRAALIARASG